MISTETPNYPLAALCYVEQTTLFAACNYFAQFTPRILVVQLGGPAAQFSCIRQAPVHEQERSGAAWMLEWMILPQMLAATGTALGKAATLLDPGALSIREDA